MFKVLVERAAYKYWKAALFLFAVIACVHFVAAFLKSLPLNLFGMLLYVLVTLVFVRKSAFKEIRIKKPTFPIYIIYGSLLVTLFVFVSYILHYYIVDFGSANFMALMAKQQLSYGVITKFNEWEYFPIAALGFVALSPLTEEFFFRGLLLKSFENKLSALRANLLQAFLFSFVHLAYFWLIEFNLGIIIPTFLGIPIGILFGWAVQKTDSLVSSIIIHAVHNFITIFLVYALIIPAIG
jgi:membrane protease YdiL (CAAX protease family)